MAGFAGIGGRLQSESTGVFPRNRWSESPEYAEAWEKIEKDLAFNAEVKAKLEEELSENGRDLEWLARCEDALPTVGHLIEEERKLEGLPSMPDVSSDFVERARAARKAVSEAQLEVNRLTSQIAKLEEQLLQCRTNPPFWRRPTT